MTSGRFVFDREVRATPMPISRGRGTAGRAVAPRSAGLLFRARERYVAATSVSPYDTIHANTSWKLEDVLWTRMPVSTVTLIAHTTEFPPIACASGMAARRRQNPFFAWA